MGEETVGGAAGAPSLDETTTWIEPTTELTRDRELELLAFYGIDGEVGRAAELARRDAEGVTARPAA